MRRKALRLRGLDYQASGYYFVTACAARRGDVFGSVVGTGVELNRTGRIVVAQVTGVGRRLPGVAVDRWIVMPDHVHAVLRLDGATGLGTVVATFKGNASREAGFALWQRGYFDHMVCDEDDLGRVREYVETNPLRWMVARASHGSPLRERMNGTRVASRGERP